jgi:hypothetical protein
MSCNISLHYFFTMKNKGRSHAYMNRILREMFSVGQQIKTSRVWYVTSNFITIVSNALHSNTFLTWILYKTAESTVFQLVYYR